MYPTIIPPDLIKNVGPYGVVILILARWAFDYYQHRKKPDPTDMGGLEKAINQQLEWQARWDEQIMQTLREHREDSLRIADEAREARTEILSAISKLHDA